MASPTVSIIWVRGAVRVLACRLAFDRPDPTDPTLYPTDHLGLSAHLETVDGG
jgi:hypothetical protein